MAGCYWTIYMLTSSVVLLVCHELCHDLPSVGVKIHFVDCMISWFPLCGISAMLHQHPQTSMLLLTRGSIKQVERHAW